MSGEGAPRTITCEYSNDALKAMQYHYATMSIRERMEHARITGFM